MAEQHEKCLENWLKVCEERDTLRAELDRMKRNLDTANLAYDQAAARAEAAEKALREAVADAYVEGFNDCAQRHTGLNEDFVIVEECYSVSIASRKLARAAGEGE
jgi:regulator of replication initiation timing